MDGWNTSFLLGWPIFRGVYPFIFTQAIFHDENSKKAWPGLGLCEAISLHPGPYQAMFSHFWGRFCLQKIHQTSVWNPIPNPNPSTQGSVPTSSKQEVVTQKEWNEEALASWWLSHPSEKSSSNWKSSSPIFGVKIPKIFDLPPPRTRISWSFKVQKKNRGWWVDFIFLARRFLKINLPGT